MVRRCEHFTEICLDDNKFDNIWGVVVVDASEGMCRRFELSNLENWGNKKQGCCSSLVEKICHFNTIVVASLFTFGRCPSIFCSTFRLLQFIFRRHSDFLTTQPASWKVDITSQCKDQVLLWHLLKPLFVALIVCKNLTIDILYYYVVLELAWVLF